jgi:dihydroorotase
MKIFIQAQDLELAQDGCMHEGAVSTRLGLTGIPVSAETTAIARDLMLIEQTGASAHFCRLSSADAVELIAAAKRKKLPVTADVTAHQLFLSEVDVCNYDSNYHVLPPLRNEADRLALIEGINQGIIDAICSDHQPQDSDSKLAPFALSTPGISALETLLPLTLRLLGKTSLTLPQLLSLITAAPAKILNLSSGNLNGGNIADVCIFSPNKIWSLAARGIISRGQNTPLLDWDLQGQVQYTFLDGNLVFKLNK